jgi:nucleotide-binding universal stress UspA family protein
MLAKRLFAAGAAREVIAVPLPERRSSIHLDTVLMMIDRDAKILVGVDGSAGGLRALRWAATEARVRGASLHVVHAWMVPLIDAIPEPWAIGTPAVGSEDKVYEHLAAAARSVLDTALEEARTAEPDLELVGELVESRAAPALLAAARDADLLVVGSRGRGGFKGLLLGSVSAQCVHHAPCPAVVVPAQHDGG